MCAGSLHALQRHPHIVVLTAHIYLAQPQDMEGGDGQAAQRIVRHHQVPTKAGPDWFRSYATIEQALGMSEGSRINLFGENALAESDVLPVQVSQLLQAEWQQLKRIHDRASEVSGAFSPAGEDRMDVLRRQAQRHVQHTEAQLNDEFHENFAKLIAARDIELLFFWEKMDEHMQQAQKHGMPCAWHAALMILGIIVAALAAFW